VKGKFGDRPFFSIIIISQTNSLHSPSQGKVTSYDDQQAFACG
jgi:hypothetical protein